jgi:metal-dependent amidase/aminoacylase/carboxypeptidase family protein
MRDAGATKGLDALFGIHVVPNLPAGIVGIRRGCLTAAAGELEILVRGEGGHGARPHQSVDAIWMAAKVVTELQQAISRRLDALQPVVVSFGKVEGGRAFNVIAALRRQWITMLPSPTFSNAVRSSDWVVIGWCL